MTSSQEPDNTAQQTGAPAAPVHPHGYTLADEELERLAAKRASGNVLDPIALNDPVGVSVERTILRVGVAVVVILIAGILLAQVACKTIKLSAMADFVNSGASTSTVERALSNGVTWGNEIVHFPSSDAEVNCSDGSVNIDVKVSRPASIEQLVPSTQVQATALAMNVFMDSAVSEVAYNVYAQDAEADEGPLVSIVWQRDPANEGIFECVLSGYTTDDPHARLESAKG